MLQLFIMRLSVRKTHKKEMAMKAKIGRPKGDRVGVRLNIYLDEEVNAKIERLATKAGISRSKLISNIMMESVTALERAEMVGILDMALLMRDFGEGLRSWVTSIREEGHQLLEWHKKGEMEETHW